MNIFLVNGEVFGFFEGDEYVILMMQCKEGVQKEGLMLDLYEEFYKWFISQVICNFYVVFIMNLFLEGFKDWVVILLVFFNRCVLNWFGDWFIEVLYQVGKEFISKMDLEKLNYIVFDYMLVVYDKLLQLLFYWEVIVNSCVFVYQIFYQVNV